MIEQLPPQLVIGLVVLAVIVWRHMRPSPATLPRLFIAPLVVLGVGVLAVMPEAAVFTRLTGTGVTFVIADVVLTLIVSVARGSSIRLDLTQLELSPARMDVRYRYGRITLLLWVASVLLKLLFAGLGRAWGLPDALADGTVLAFLGLSVLAQNVVLLARCRYLIGDARARRRGDEGSSTAPAD